MTPCGVLDAGGALVVGLLPRDGAGVAGVAYLPPGADPAQTDASLFVAGPALEATAAQVAATREAAEDGAAAAAAAEAADFASGGLGLTLDAFESTYGESQEDPIGPAYPVTNGRVVARADATGRIDYVERFFDEGVSISDATAEGLALAPADAVLVETYVTETDITVDLYYSESLAALLPDTVTVDGTEFDTWTNGEPGNFTVGYSGYNPALGIDVVTRLVMGLGNNP